MAHRYKISLFIFRRDLRLEDNTGLIAALQQSELVLPCFIFDPRQVGEENEYRSARSITFMLNSLVGLDEQLQKHGGRLYRFYGVAHELLERVLDEVACDAVFVNRDYTPFSIRRDELLEQVCNRHAIPFHSLGDALIHEPEDIISQNGSPYVIFTPFFKKASRITVRSVTSLPSGTWHTRTSPLEQQALPYYQQLSQQTKSAMHTRGGRKEGLVLLDGLSTLKNYQATRDIPALPTSNLSAHLKFGTLSIREVLHAIELSLGKFHPLAKQIYWRDFFTHVAYHSPFVFGYAYQEKFDSLAWEHNIANFKRWCFGTTGFPIVDAGMRQLNETGYMHNRVRMIVASFLTKDLRIDWRWGEKYFAQQLIDYDPAVNNGNWQWIASVGCDSQPYFRIFNPWLQQKKFDPDAIYIKRWIPELRSTSPSIIHAWYQTKRITDAPAYPRPMINHAQEAAYTKEWFRKHKLEKD